MSNNDDVLIPYKYTKFAHVSSLPVLFLSCVSFKRSQYLLSFFAFLVYLSTNLHWYKLKPTGIVRKTDIFFVNCLAIYGYYIIYYSCYPFFFTYNVITFFNASCFFYNEHLNYKSLYHHNFNSLTPDKKHRIYVRSCLLHMFVGHYFQPLTMSFFLLYLYTPY